LALSLTFLGTGGAFTDFRLNYHNNALIHTRDGYVLLDCGGSAMQSLKELGVNPKEIAAVLITHMHGDHVSGLEQLIWERYYSGVNGPSFKTTRVVATPDVWASIRAFLEPLIREFTDSTGTIRDDGIDALVRPECLDGDPLGDALESRGEVLTIGGVSFQFHRTPHVQSEATGVSKPCYGVRVWDEEGGEMYYTSDTEFRVDIGERFPASDVIFHDSTFTPLYPGSVHTHYSELLSLPETTKNRVVLMHFTRVPDGIDVRESGFVGAARRHDTWMVNPKTGAECVSSGPIGVDEEAQTSGLEWVDP
jgi:ribonuclease BN (tRNA processing enzyme)